jgi:DNA-directed RNA polymerase subunit RPC12/RpoP
MQRHVNVTIPLSCPHCQAELLTTLDDLQQETAIQCLQCGTRVDLRPEDLPMPPLCGEVREESFYGIEF